MPTTCNITFNNSNRVFYSGQLLSGTVRLNLWKEKRVRGVYIKIFGKGNVQWSEYCTIDHDPQNQIGNRSTSPSTRKMGHTVYYTSSEDYLNEKIYFFGGPNACNVLTI